MATTSTAMMKAEVLEHGVLKECTFMPVGRTWNAQSKSSPMQDGVRAHAALYVRIGGVELEDGEQYLVIRGDNRYTVKVEMALGLTNHCRVVLEWPEVAPYPSKPVAVQDSGFW